jgi:hypothetical protein
MIDPRVYKGKFYLPEPDPDGRTVVPVKQIGKGKFTIAYLTQTGTPYVYLKTRESDAGDYSKRQLAELNMAGEQTRGCEKEQGSLTVFALIGGKEAGTLLRKNSTGYHQQAKGIPNKIRDINLPMQSF